MVVGRDFGEVLGLLIYMVVMSSALEVWLAGLRHAIEFECLPHALVIRGLRESRENQLPAKLTDADRYISRCVHVGSRSSHQPNERRTP